jgi:hypothetical protein
MADRYDPKVSPRPASDRRPGEPRRNEPGMEDDPLAELAKIVQGRPTGASASSRGRAAAANDQKPPSGGNAISDLEAELLNDLQASFAAVREAAAAPTSSQPKPAPAPPSQPMTRTRPEPDLEPEEAFSPPAMFTRAAPPPSPAPPKPEPEPEVRAEQRHDPSEIPPPRFVPIPPPPVMQPPVVQRTVPEPPPERPSRAARPPLAGDARPDTRTDVGSSFQLRSTAPVASNPPPLSQQSRLPHSRWEKPEPAKPQASTASRFAPPRGAPTPQPQPSFDDLDDDTDPFAEGGVFAQGTTEHSEAEFPLEGFGLAPAYGDEDGPPEAGDDDDQPAMARPRRNRGLLIAGAVVAVAVIGGVAFVLFNSGGGGGSTTTPPTIAADSGPTKVTPDDTAVAADTDSQNKLIYDRINAGDKTGTNTATTAPDTSTTTAPAADAANPNSRVIIPGGPGIDAPQTDDALRLDEQPDAVSPPAASGAIDTAANDTAPSADEVDAIGPRKVRTVVVKPDGTIVSSNATDVPAANSDAAAPAATDTAAAPPPADTAPSTPPVAATDTAPAPVTDDTAAIAGSQGKELPITTTPDATTTPLAETPPATIAEAPKAVTTAPATAPPKAVVVQPAPAPTRPTKVATANDQPIDLTSAPPAAAAQTAAGGVLVQISSQKSEEAARTTYRDLQARYPRILGKFDANIQRAAIPDRGTFFRVRVGPFSASDAQRLCDDLKSAGGDCVLARK